MLWMLVVFMVNFVEYLYVNLDDNPNTYDAEKEPQCCTRDGNAGKEAGKKVLRTLL